jgi:hypothetical protein
VKKFIIALSVIVGVLLILFFVAGYFLGNVPIASKLLGTNKPKNLGVVINMDNAYSGIKKVNCPLTGQAVKDIMANPSSYTTVKATLTSDEASSLMAIGDVPNLPVRLTQIKFGPNGTFQTSGVVNTEELQKALRSSGASSDTIDKIMGYVKKLKYFNFYAEGTLNITNNHLTGSVSTAKIGNISVPGDVLEKIDSGVASTVMNKLQQTGYSIRNLTISEGKVTLDMDRPLSDLNNWVKFAQY